MPALAPRLSANEVRPGWVVDLDRQFRSKKLGWIIFVTCPQCKKRRRMRVAILRRSTSKTLLCRSCYLRTGNASPLTTEECNRPNMILYPEKQKMIRESTGRKQAMLNILGECTICHVRRWMRVNSIRSGRLGSTDCLYCARKRQRHKFTSGGTQIANGYRMIHLMKLSHEDCVLAEKYLRPYKRYVYEHRLVALKTYGPAMAAPGVVVRHIDGDKLNNAPENLMLGSQGENIIDHMTANRELKAWRATALYLFTLIANLELDC